MKKIYSMYSKKKTNNSKKLRRLKESISITLNVNVSLNKVAGVFQFSSLHMLE